MCAEVNAGAMHQNIPHRWPCLSGSWRSRIQKSIVSCWMFILCLSILNTALMAQAAPTENEDPTDTSSNEPTPTESPSATVINNSSALDGFEDLIIPRSNIAAVIFLVDGFVLCLFSDVAKWTKQFMMHFSVAALEAYVFCIAVVLINTDENDSGTVIACIIASGVIGVLIGFSALHWPISNPLIASAIGCFIGVGAIVLLEPMYEDPYDRRVFRGVLLGVPMVTNMYLGYGHGPNAMYLIKSLTGSFATALGIDFFVETRFTIQVMSFLGTNPDPPSSNPATTTMWVFTILLGLSGWLSKIGTFLQKNNNRFSTRSTISSSSASVTTGGTRRATKTDVAIGIYFVYVLACVILKSVN